MGDQVEDCGWWVYAWGRTPSWCRDRLVNGKTFSERGDGDVCSTGQPFATEQEARAFYSALGNTEVCPTYLANPWFELAHDGATIEERQNPQYVDEDERDAYSTVRECHHLDHYDARGLGDRDW